MENKRHEHDTHHHHDAHCNCGHDHHHEHHEHHHHDAHRMNHGKHIYILENLGCANCAAKMESKINQLPGVNAATITFATKQLRLDAQHPEMLLDPIQSICASIEPDVKIVSQISNNSNISDADNHTEHHKDLLQIISGAVLFAAGIIFTHFIPEFKIIGITIFVIAYLILGIHILITAAKNIGHGQIFDENFLMSIATLGAFIIQEYPEAVGVMLFYRIGEYFEERAVEKSRSQIMDAIDMRPENVNVIKNGHTITLPAKDASIGDILLIRPGDRIPLDGTVIDGESRIDTSPITGEPVPVMVKAGTDVISGCINTYGQLKMQVNKTLSESMVTKILNSVENAAASKPQIDRFITKFARIYTPIVVILALATAILPSIFTGDWNYWVYTALTFLVMSCPCALVLSVPLAFFSGIGAGSKIGILFKGGLSLEALTKVKTIVMDKTGTITEGNFKVQEIISASPTMDKDTLLSIAAGCEYASTHPIGTSIVSFAQEKHLTIDIPDEIHEIAGCGIHAKNNNQTLLCGNRKLMHQFGVDLSLYQNDMIGTEVLIAVDSIYVGCIVIADTIKADAREAINKIKRQSITTAMFTGDSEENAQSIALQTGIEEIKSRLLPQDKLEELQKHRTKYGPVMFVGDGINDAPVLAGADVGAAMGTGADAAIEAADVVFMTSKMHAIPQAIAIAKLTNKISWQNVIFALVVKIAVMILGLCGLASMWMAVFADTGVAMICILNSIRILYNKNIK